MFEEHNENEILDCIKEQSMIDIKTIDTFNEYKDRYNFDLYHQRDFVWDNFTKSNLIISLLTNHNVPLFVVNMRDNQFRFIDGKNRANAILQFYNNKYPLNKKIKLIRYNGKTYNLREMYFRDFPSELAELLKSKTIKLEVYHNLTDKEEAENILRLNSGVKMTGISKARLNSYGVLLPIVGKITTSELFIRKVNIRESDRIKSKIDEKIVFSLIAKECGILVNDNFEVMVRNIEESSNFTNDLIENINQNLDYLNLAIPMKVKYLNSSWIIPIYQIVKKYKNTLNERDFYSLMNEIFNNHYNDIHVEGDWNNNNALNERIRLLDIECESIVRKDNVEVG